MYQNLTPEELMDHLNQYSGLEIIITFFNKLLIHLTSETHNAEGSYSISTESDPDLYNKLDDQWDEITKNLQEMAPITYVDINRIMEHDVENKQFLVSDLEQLRLVINNYIGEVID